MIGYRSNGIICFDGTLEYRNPTQFKHDTIENEHKTVIGQHCLLYSTIHLSRVISSIIQYHTLIIPHFV